DVKSEVPRLVATQANPLGPTNHVYSLPRRVQKKRGHAFVSPAEDDQEVGQVKEGDMPFLALQAVTAVSSRCGRTDVRGIRTRPGVGERVGADFSLRETSEVGLLLVFSSGE